MKIFSAPVALATAAVTVLGLALAAPAVATPGGPVSQTPASFTPWLLREPVYQNVQQMRQCGGTMYAVGTISAIGQSTKTYTRSNAFSFSATTGAVTSWSPQVNGPVSSVTFSPNCATAYLGGSFSSVNGTPAANIVAVSTSTGAVQAGFKHSANGAVNTLQYTHGAVLAGGFFTSINGAARTRLASLDPVTGSATSYANLAITGTYPKAPTKIYNSQLSHSGAKMLVEGVFTSIGGKARRQVAMLDLGTTSVSVDNWYAPQLDQECVDIESFYARGANWSPDDATVYIATTGYKPKTGPGSNTSGPRAGLCDVAAAFPATSTTVTTKWINYTGCDSLYAVVADANDVYIGGHQRFANNPNGCDAPGPGSVSRLGLADLSPSTGLATPWNPTRSLGHGVNDFLVTPAGLWIASDTFKNGGSQYCGHVGNKGGICFLPY